MVVEGLRWRLSEVILMSNKQSIGLLCSIPIEAIFVKKYFKNFAGTSARYILWILICCKFISVAEKCILKWAIPGLFFLIFVFSIQLLVNKICWWMGLILATTTAYAGHTCCMKSLTLFAIVWKWSPTRFQILLNSSRYPRILTLTLPWLWWWEWRRT